MLDFISISGERLWSELSGDPLPLSFDLIVCRPLIKSPPHQQTQTQPATTLWRDQGLCSKDLPGRHSILSMLGIIFDKSVAET